MTSVNHELAVRMAELARATAIPRHVDAVRAFDIAQRVIDTRGA